MTKEEFIAEYRSKMDTPFDQLVCLPCNCQDPSCRGWAMIRNNPDAIADHEELCRMREKS